MSKNKTYLKVFCRFVKSFIDLKSRQNLFSRSRKRTTLEDFDQQKY